MDRGVTPNQMKALHAGFNELGYARRSDRGDRLAAATQALGREEPLASFSDLNFGAAGILVRCLREAGVPNRNSARTGGTYPTVGNENADQAGTAEDPEPTVTPPAPQAAPPGERAPDAELATSIGTVLAVLLLLAARGLRQVWRRLESSPRWRVTGTGRVPVAEPVGPPARA